MKKIVTFESVHFTIKADRLLKMSGLEYQIVTTPREISTDCGMSIEVSPVHVKQVEHLLTEHGFSIKIHTME